jgi:hypothetical protein
MFIVGVDLGKTQDYTAISIVERQEVPVPTPKPHTERHYHLRYLHRPPLGTPYPAIVDQVIGLLDAPPLDRGVALVVDKTGVGGAVVDMFTAAGVKPRAITITSGNEANTEDPYNLKVPKKELASTLVALYQGRRLKTAKDLPLAQTLLTELVNFKVKIHLNTGHDSYEAWRENIHDDLVLSVALACWHGESAPQLPFGWIRNDPAFEAQFQARQAPAAVETDEARVARRLAARGMVPDEGGGHRYGAPLPNPWLPERLG